LAQERKHAAEREQFNTALSNIKERNLREQEQLREEKEESAKLIETLKEQLRLREPNQNVPPESGKEDAAALSNLDSSAVLENSKALGGPPNKEISPPGTTLPSSEEEAAFHLGDMSDMSNPEDTDFFKK
jgi:hypothetical protein